MKASGILKLFLYISVIFFLFSCARYESGISVVAVDPLDKVFKESCFPSSEALADVARGEYASFQFVVKSAFAINSLTADIQQASSGNSQLSDAKYYFVGYVKVQRQLFVSPEDRLSTPTGYFPDPLIPEKEMNIEAGHSQAIWITVPIPKNAEPGTYKGKVNFSGKINGRKFSITRDYTIIVYPVVVNKPRLWNTNWYSCVDFSYLNEGKPVESFSQEYWKYLKMTADIMAEYGQNVAYVSPTDNIKFSKVGNEWHFDYTNFDKAVQVFIDTGVIGRIEGGHFAWGNTLTALQLTVPAADSAGLTISGYQAEISNPAVRHFYKSFYPAFISHLKEKGWDKIYMQHISDEPSTKVINSYIEISKFLKSLVPEIKILDAADRIELAGAVDIWVPLSDNFDEHMDFYQERAKKGDELWFYTCCAPTGRYLNRFIEYPLMKTRLLSWMNFKYDATGFLHYGYNQWSFGDNGVKDIYKAPDGYYPHIFPAGDRFIVYPYKSEIIPSIRLEATRDGLYDYELLKMLEEKDTVAARNLCNSIMLNFKHYDLNTTGFHQVRKKLLENLSK